MRSAKPALLLMAVAVVVLVGCGKSRVYTVNETSSCLRSNGVAVRRDTNPFADTSGGALQIDHGDYNVFITFAADASAAKKSETRLKALATGFGAEDDPNDIVKRRGNVVYYSSGAFPDDAQRQVTDCLR